MHPGSVERIKQVLNFAEHFHIAACRAQTTLLSAGAPTFCNLHQSYYVYPLYIADEICILMRGEPGKSVLACCIKHKTMHLPAKLTALLEVYGKKSKEGW